MSLVQIPQQTDFTLAYCSFLDEFERSGYAETCIEAEPPAMQDREQACLLAATAAKLAADHGLTVPSWTKKPQYVMPAPTYAFETQNPDYQAHLRQTSFKEFADRNLFYGDNVFGRV